MLAGKSRHIGVQLLDGGRLSPALVARAAAALHLGLGGRELHDAMARGFGLAAVDGVIEVAGDGWSGWQASVEQVIVGRDLLGWRAPTAA